MNPEIAAVHPEYASTSYIRSGRQMGLYSLKAVILMGLDSIITAVS